ncbi:MAG: four helix bundle protein, partial [Terriglobales bacterium]
MPRWFEYNPAQSAIFGNELEGVLMRGSYVDLRVWQQGMELARNVYHATARFPKSELYGLVNQMRRAAVSVPSNIAEG